MNAVKSINQLKWLRKRDICDSRVTKSLTALLYNCYISESLLFSVTFG